MTTEEFIQKHKELKKAIRTYIMIFMKSSQENYLRDATECFNKLKEQHLEFKRITGKCPTECLAENHKQETEHRAKLKEIETELEKARNAKLNKTETETEYKPLHGKVTWKKGA